LTLPKLTSVIYAAVTSGELLVTPREAGMADKLLDKSARIVSGTRGQVRTATFPRQVKIAPQARRFVTNAIGRHRAGGDAVLLAGELVANSLLHAHDATKVTVAVTVNAAFIRVEVVDNGTKGIPHWRDVDEAAEDGRGFHLVNLLARRWGFTRGQDRTCCWFEVTATRAA
jgi:anti-sigma regulatory factor (Ser/Thr protein kinase)